jgi:hypothetical protein
MYRVMDALAPTSGLFAETRRRAAGLSAWIKRTGLSGSCRLSLSADRICVSGDSCMSQS